LRSRQSGSCRTPSKDGIKFAATYIGEGLGNVTGGLKQGVVYEGRLNFAVDVDLQKFVGLKETAFHANMFQIHGEGLSRSNLQNFLVASGIEALPSTRLYEMWFERKWGTTIALRAGQLAADTEFMNAKYTDVLPMHRWAGRQSRRSICPAEDHRPRCRHLVLACGRI
jgi:porin